MVVCIDFESARRRYVLSNLLFHRTCKTERVENEPTRMEPGEPLETFLRTVVFGAYLERIPEREREPFVHDVASRLPEPVIDYVRLNITATRGRS